jgi:ubiquinone/menaquinone biosynthesis C-methylase UbiE
MPHDTEQTIIDWYTHGTDEAARLGTAADGRLEMTRTRELLERYLPPPPARVLDVGGGPGTHARWLASAGYQIHLIDPVPRHIDQAATIDGCTAELGDARKLSAPDNSYDVVLVLGPLYHLLERDDRITALREAGRVTAPGGLIAAAAINRYASIGEHTSTGGLSKESLEANIKDILVTGQYDGHRGFTVAAFHTAAELAEEIGAAGLNHETVHSIEGPMWALVKAVELRQGSPLADDDPVMISALRAARMAEPYPELLAASSHLLAIAHA